MEDIRNSKSHLIPKCNIKYNRCQVLSLTLPPHICTDSSFSTSTFSSNCTFIFIPLHGQLNAASLQHLVDNITVNDNITGEIYCISMIHQAVFSSFSQT